MSNLQIPNPKSCPVLQQGSTGAWVVCLQNALNGIGYGPININGYFDPQTTAIIKIFQQKLGLDADGTVGVHTWSALDRQPTLPGWEPYWPILETAAADTSSGVPLVPPSGSMNQTLLTAALNLRGMSTAEGPDGGNNACAWSINRVLHKAGISPLGENPNYVPSLVDALKGGRGQLVSRSEALAGDLVVAYEEAHVGVGLDEGCATVLSNSSSRACFIWESSTDFDDYYGGPSTIYRLIQ
ncbi:MAG TPA: peptidoglycan-binding domain-containing protein [Coleofasciculaceae cyanobacterium]|jgi:hypothetical protein